MINYKLTRQAKEARQSFRSRLSLLDMSLEF